MLVSIIEDVYMEINYSKNDHGVKQSISTVINADVPTVFRYLSTTEGLQQWFPQLVIVERKPQGTMLFVRDEITSNEKMTITDFEENKMIGFTWDTGNIWFELQQQNDLTIVSFTEYLPFEFPHIVLDFTGWQFQIDNVTQLIENGATLDQQQIDFKARQQQIATALEFET